MTAGGAVGVPLSRPLIENDEIEAVAEVLRSGWITAGPRVLQFERQFAERVGARHAVAVQSGTSALVIALQALELPAGSEVVIPAFTWPSAVAAALFVGLVPVLADVEWASLNVSARTLQSALSPRTRAIVPVHFAGLPYDAEEIAAMANRVGAVVIDDAAHALGASYAEGPLGRHTKAACYSFHPIKNITTGEGGMITTDDDAFEEKARRLRLLGINRDAWQRYGTGSPSAYDITELSLKHNMTDIQAAIGIVQLAKLNRMNDRRRTLAERYMERLSLLKALILPEAGDARRQHAWHLFVIRTQDEHGPRGRDAVVAALAKRGISTGLHFLSVAELSYFRARLKLDPAATPNALRAGRTVISLPLYPGMTDEDQRAVIAALHDILA